MLQHPDHFQPAELPRADLYDYRQSPHHWTTRWSAGIDRAAAGGERSFSSDRHVLQTVRIQVQIRIVGEDTPADTVKYVMPISFLRCWKATIEFSRK